MVLMQKVVLLSKSTENVRYFLWKGHFHSFRTYIFELIILVGLIFASF